MVPPFYSSHVSHGVLVRFLRFRLGCHHLRVHTGRWHQPSLPRTLRTCLRCSTPTAAPLDDEAHCLFQCDHPTLVEARDLFMAGVPSLSRYADFWSLASAGRVPLPALIKFVAVCVRVSWSCYRHGGTDVVELPDVLLPAGAYLDLFDSASDSDEEEWVEIP